MLLKTIVLFLLFVNSLYASEESIYQFDWMDQDKQIYVLQNREFEKDKSVILSLLGSKTMSNKFVDTYYGVVKAGYYFNEDWGVEFIGGYGTGSTNETADSVRVQNAVPFYRKIDHYFGGVVNWAPLYGKFNAFDSILYLDWFFGAGIAAVTTRDNRLEFGIDKNKSLTTDTGAGLIWQTGFLFYLNKSWMVRFEFQGIHFQADLITEESNVQTSNKTMFNHYDLNLGIAFKF